MTFRVFVKWRKHDWKDGFHIVANEITEVLIIPEVERSLRNLSSDQRITRLALHLVFT